MTTGTGTPTLTEYLGLEQSRDKNNGMSERDFQQYKFFTELRLDQAGVILVTGNLGGGKSTWDAWCAYVRRKLFGYPVVSNILFKPAFGDYTYLSTERLVEEFQKVNSAVEKEAKRYEHSKKLSDRDKEVASSAWENSKVSLYRSTINWDEGYGSMDKRRGHSPKLILLGYLVQAWRHFQSLIIISASTKWLLDDYRINPFRTHEVVCSFFPGLNDPIGTAFYRVYATQLPYNEIGAKNYNPNAPTNPKTMHLAVSNWTPLFDSFCPVAVDEGILKGVLKENKL